MTLLKRLSLCLSLCLLLISCSGKETPATDSATAGEEAPATTTENAACAMTPEPGPCKAQIEKFYFDQATKKCASFNYGGCQGTVPFETLDTCQAACEVDSMAANEATAPADATAMPADATATDAAATPADAAPAADKKTDDTNTDTQGS
jgi:hypothetical protein